MPSTVVCQSLELSEKVLSLLLNTLPNNIIIDYPIIRSSEIRPDSPIFFEIPGGMRCFSPPPDGQWWISGDNGAGNDEQNDERDEDNNQDDDNDNEDEEDPNQTQRESWDGPRLEPRERPVKEKEKINDKQTKITDFVRGNRGGLPRPIKTSKWEPYQESQLRIT